MLALPRVACYKGKRAASSPEGLGFRVSELPGFGGLGQIHIEGFFTGTGMHTCRFTCIYIYTYVHTHTHRSISLCLSPCRSLSLYIRMHPPLPLLIYAFFCVGLFTLRVLQFKTLRLSSRASSFASLKFKASYNEVLPFHW